MSVDPLKTCHPSSKTPGVVVTAAGRMTFVAVAAKFFDKKKADDDGQYCVTLVIPPGADLDLLKGIVKAAAVEKFGAKLPGGLKNPLRDAGEVDREGHEKGWTMIRANTYTTAPGVVDGNGQSVSNLRPGEEEADRKARVEDQAYSGRWARLTVSAKGYDQNGNKGVKFYLNNVQLLKDDARLGRTRVSAEDDFAPVGGFEGGSDFGSSTGAADETADSIFG